MQLRAANAALAAECASCCLFQCHMLPYKRTAADTAAAAVAATSLAMLIIAAYVGADVGGPQKWPVGAGVIQAWQRPGNCTAGTVLVLEGCDVQVIVRELARAACTAHKA